MLADGRLVGICTQALVVLSGSGASPAISRVTTIASGFLHERLAEIARAKAVSVSRLAKVALRSSYALNGSGKNAKAAGS